MELFSEKKNSEKIDGRNVADKRIIQLERNRNFFRFFFLFSLIHFSIPKTISPLCLKHFAHSPQCRDLVWVEREEL